MRSKRRYVHKNSDGMECTRSLSVKRIGSEIVENTSCPSGNHVKIPLACDSVAFGPPTYKGSDVIQ